MEQLLPNLPGMSLAQELLSGEDPRDLGNTEASLLRRLLEVKEEGIGLFLFSKLIFGYKDLTLTLHLPICRLLSRWGETVHEDGWITRDPPSEFHLEEHGEIQESYRRLMITIPRGCFKTSLCTRANPVWQIARDPTHNPTFGIFNEKAENSEKWVYAIAQTIERSRLFQLLWPEMIPRGISYADKEKGVTQRRDIKWGAKGILFEREAILPECSIEPQGVGGAHAGKHYTHKILDDIIGRDAAYSPAVMENANEWVDNSRPLEQPPENGCELVAHTPWAHGDTYTHMLSKWPGEYRVYRRHILENDLGEPDLHTGKSIFPERISTRQAKKLFEIDPFINHAQYLCLPLPSREQSFQQEWIHYGTLTSDYRNPSFQILPEHYDPRRFDPECGDDLAPRVVPLSWMSKAILLDPAPSKPTEIRKEPRAANGIVVVGKDPWNRRFLLQALPVRDTPNRVFEIIQQLSEEWFTNRIGIEEVNFSAVYAPLWREIGQYKYPDWKPEFFPLYTKGWEKFSRIKQMLIPPYENGFWYYNTRGTSHALKEVIEFGTTGAPVDILDASSYTDDALDRPESPSEQERSYYRRHQVSQDRGQTGYGRFMQQESF